VLRRQAPEDREQRVGRRAERKRVREARERVEAQQEVDAALLHERVGVLHVGQQRLEHARRVVDRLGEVGLRTESVEVWDRKAIIISLQRDSSMRVAWLVDSAGYACGEAQQTVQQTEVSGQRRQRDFGWGLTLRLIDSAR
jgi:tRNA(Phe) wybutosine-synthesizing methylase Tyw3